MAKQKEAGVGAKKTPLQQMREEFIKLKVVLANANNKQKARAIPVLKDLITRVKKAVDGADVMAADFGITQQLQRDLANYYGALRAQIPRHAYPVPKKKVANAESPPPETE